jgi:hypothetical protein
MTKNLVAASILGVMITLATLLYKTVPLLEYPIPFGQFYFYRGFPLPIYRETGNSVGGSFVGQFFVLYAVVDFLLFFGSLIAVLTVLTRVYLAHRGIHQASAITTLNETSAETTPQ